MSQALSFNDVTLTPVIHHQTPWIRSAELAQALGYSDERSVSKIYQRNAEEFSDDMTQVIEISEGVNLTTKIRIFSLRGCHLLAMFARTPVAKAFRVWVLDVLEKLNQEKGQSSLPALSTADDRAPLRSLVHAWSQASGMHHSALWPQVKAYFQLSNLNDLPADWIPDALAFVQGKIDALQLAGRKALPARVPAQSPLVNELEVLHRAIDEKRVELMHWARGVDREISRLTGQLYKDVCWSLPNPRRCLDPGIECLHFARHSGLDKLEDGMADLYSALRFATFFARSM